MRGIVMLINPQVARCAQSSSFVVARREAAIPDMCAAHPFHVTIGWRH